MPDLSRVTSTWMQNKIKTMLGVNFNSSELAVVVPDVPIRWAQEERLHWQQLIVIYIVIECIKIKIKQSSHTRRCLSALRCFTMKCTSFSLARLYAAWLRSGSNLFEHLLTSACGLMTLSSTGSSENSTVSSLVMVNLSDSAWGYFLLTGKPV